MRYIYVLIGRSKPVCKDIVDKNLKLVLGLLWMIILRFTIADIK